MNEAKNTLKALHIIHKALLLGQIIFAAIAFFLKYTASFPSAFSDIDQFLQIIAVIVSFGGFFIGSSLLKKRVRQVLDTFQGVSVKAEVYRSASIVQWVLLEGPSLFCIICFLLTGNYAFLALSAALMLVFALTAPSKLKVMLMMHLSEEEMDFF